MLFFIESDAVPFSQIVTTVSTTSHTSISFSKTRFQPYTVGSLSANYFITIAQRDKPDQNSAGNKKPELIKAVRADQTSHKKDLRAAGEALRVAEIEKIIGERIKANRALLYTLQAK